jgi:hypothetical protein
MNWCVANAVCVEVDRHGLARKISLEIRLLAGVGVTSSLIILCIPTFILAKFSIHDIEL